MPSVPIAKISSENRRQFLATLCVNIITLGHGCAIGWLSPFLPVLLSTESPLRHGPITIEQASWVGALLCVGGLIGSFVFGSIADRFGRKTAIGMLALPHMCYWLLIIFATDYYHLYMARLCAGLSGGGLFVTIPLFVSEIADDKIRGTLGSMLLLSCNVGILNGFITGAFLSYEIVPRIMLCLPVVFLIGIWNLYETPHYLVRCNKLEEALVSIKFYRGIDVKCKQINEKVQLELEELKLSSGCSDKSSIKFQDLCTPEAKKALFICLLMMTVNQFSGMFAIINYTATIFRQSGSDLDANTSAIVVGVIQICGTYVSALLVDKLGRKILLLVSSSGAGIGLSILGAFSFLSRYDIDLSSVNWIPLASLSFVIFIASVGILNLPFVIMGEILPPKIRSIGSSISMSLISSFAFIILKIFPTLLENIQLYGCMWIFSAVCMVGTIVLFFILPETNGKHLSISTTIEKN